MQFKVEYKAQSDVRKWHGNAKVWAKNGAEATQRAKAMVEDAFPTIDLRITITNVQVINAKRGGA